MNDWWTAAMGIVIRGWDMTGALGELIPFRRVPTSTS